MDREHNPRSVFDVIAESELFQAISSVKRNWNRKFAGVSDFNESEERWIAAFRQRESLINAAYRALSSDTLPSGKPWTIMATKGTK